MDKYVCLGGAGSRSPPPHDIIIGAKSHFPRHRDVPLQTRGVVFYFPSGMEEEAVGLGEIRWRGPAYFWVCMGTPMAEHHVGCRYANAEVTSVVCVGLRDPP